jgi:hypothetical protein
MRSFHFRKTTDKALIEKHTSSVSHESQPESSGSNANEQATATNSPSTQVRLDQHAPTTIQEKSGLQVRADNHPEYPHGLKLATITIAVALSVFLVALVRNPETDSFQPPHDLALMLFTLNRTTQSSRQQSPESQIDFTESTT